MHQYYLKQLEQIIKTNLSHRGMDKVFLEDELRKAAESLLGGGTILIVTGFAIRDVLAGETDGPLGAVSLAGALEQLGKKVVFITDAYSESILKQCSSARGVKAPIEVINDDMDKRISQWLIRKYRPSHAIAIERPGTAADGRCYSMRGEDLSDIIPNVDALFEEAKVQGITTIGIGDGGNEIGMGKIRPYIVYSVYKGAQISAVFASDYLIVAGVSNWGGHALAAALSLLTQKMLLHDMNTEILMLRTMVEAGAVDGCTKKRTMTVDGLSFEDNLRVFLAINNIAVKSVMYFDSEGFA